MLSTFHPFAHETKEGAHKMNQFANWANIAAGIHSTTASERVAREGAC